MQLHPHFFCNTLIAYVPSLEWAYSATTTKPLELDQILARARADDEWPGGRRCTRFARQRLTVAAVDGACCEVTVRAPYEMDDGSGSDFRLARVW